ncbi:substrate-binding domain-containing protein [Streptomyces sp. TRM66268-LWL]|uniref:Substrate-binding domain-containing protein n=1 Tax=Streptomyces polyasparticus TaxID=2767826 RepID=A0ABR7SDZ5_9ACTN|nr:substrate-binding domain-containing protein [Streptomyces polyasparticus]MBC9712812.1 substrate-binding domain-containing protein [Streptomyces polyasparticus]
MRTSRSATGVAAFAAAAVLLAGCSSSGGKDSEEKPEEAGGGKVSGPRLTIAMVTHSGKGDAFWDIVQKGAKAAAAKDNVEFLYASDDQAKEQAALVQSYIDKKVDGIVVTLAKPEAMKDVLGKAKTAGIPVITINSGGQFAKEYGALNHVGQDESVAGEAVGAELEQRGRKKALCVIHEQGNVSLEERCAGVKKAFGGDTENINVPGTDMPQTQSQIAAKLQATEDIDTIVTLNAGIAEAAIKAKGDAGSEAEVSTFDLNEAVTEQMKAKEIVFAVDQQPYLQGYLAVDGLWLYRNNLNVIGGGQQVLTGPAIVTEKDVAQLEKLTKNGTR